MPVPVAKTLTGEPYSIALWARSARAGQRDYALITMTTRRMMLCAAALLATACTRVVDGTVAAEFGAAANLSGVDVERVLLDQSRMQAITGGDEHLTIIPSMDATSPVDIDTLARTAPPECRFVYADTATFGPDIEAFHKTTFQDPPHGGLISEGAAAYRDSSAGLGLVGVWQADDRSLQTRPGDCGRDYLLKSLVLVEVTYCGFPDSVSTIVISNIAANLPG
jgi:hypothetical protein